MGGGTPGAGAPDIEAEVVRIAGDVLDVECGPADDFFDLGGSSLAAIRILGLVQERFDVEVSLMEFFDAPDLGSFARLVEERR